MTKTVLALSLLVSVLVAGCVTNTVTNLTATEVPRSPNGMYRLEYQWDSNQQTVLPDTIKPTVLVGFNQYEMKKVMKTPNRFEAWVPVPAGQSEISYRFKVDYQYNAFGDPKNASKLSQDYKLIVK